MIRNIMALPMDIFVREIRLARGGFGRG